MVVCCIDIRWGFFCCVLVMIFSFMLCCHKRKTLQKQQAYLTDDTASIHSVLWAGTPYTKSIASPELRHKEHNNGCYPLHKLEQHNSASPILWEDDINKNYQRSVLPVNESSMECQVWIWPYMYVPETQSVSLNCIGCTGNCQFVWSMRMLQSCFEWKWYHFQIHLYWWFLRLNSRYWWP